MTAALHGNLRDFGIGEVFQLIGQQRKSGALEVDADGERIRVLFSEGCVVSAETVGPHDHAAIGDMLVRSGLLTADQLVAVERERGEGALDFRRLLIQHTDLSADEIDEIARLVTEDTLFSLLRASSGSFHFHPRSVTPSRRAAPLLPAEQILMDGLRMVDEWRALDPQATDEDSVFQRVGRLESFREYAGAGSSERLAAAEHMLLAVDGRTPARRLIDRSRLGTFEGARLLSDLRRAGVIAALDPESVLRAQRRIAASGLGARALSALAAVAPFVLLFATAALLWRPASPAEPGLRFPIDREPLELAQRAFALRRMRNLVDAHRFAAGDWPVDLGELAARGWISSEALAGPGGAPYATLRRPEGLVVLAPPH